MRKTPVRNKKIYLVVDAVTALMLLALDQFTKHLAIEHLSDTVGFAAFKESSSLCIDHGSVGASVS